MEDDELKFGPNGGLVFSMEFLMENTEWLEVGCHQGGRARTDFSLAWLEAA
jgi:hypothetical protein